MLYDMALQIQQASIEAFAAAKISADATLDTLLPLSTSSSSSLSTSVMEVCYTSSFMCAYKFSPSFAVSNFHISETADGTKNEFRLFRTKGVGTFFTPLW
jgi:hypothetical protein